VGIGLHKGALPTPMCKSVTVSGTVIVSLRAKLPENPIDIHHQAKRHENQWLDESLDSGDRNGERNLGCNHKNSTGASWYYSRSTKFCKKCGLNVQNSLNDTTTPNSKT
jgi:hypothetical protein